MSPPVASASLRIRSWRMCLAAHAAITGHGFGQQDLWPLLDRFGLARHLMSARAA